MELELENISKKYGNQYALKNFTTSLTEGVYGILGPNGAGKTTLISIIIGILKSNEGNVYLDGRNVKEMGVEYLDKIGFLPQYPTFYKNFTTKEFLKYMCALKGIPKNKVDHKIWEVLSLVNLEESTKKKVGALSGGMRQRLGIAQAILNDPEILVLDEPTAGLDPGERIRFRNIISKLSKNRLVLLATHIVPDVECIAKEILIIKRGILVKKGTPDELSKSIEGYVWEIETDEVQMEKWMEQYSIGNVKREKDKYRLRIVSKDKPAPEAFRIQPSLEDVFLYIFDSER